MLKKEDLGYCVCNPIWNYFSGNTYNSKLLLDYGLMNAQEYTQFIGALASQRRLPRVPQTINLTLSDLSLCRYDGTMIDPLSKEPFVHSCEGAFNLMLLYYGALKLRALELGLLSDSMPKPMTEKTFAAFHHIISKTFAVNQSNSFDLVNGADFVFNTIADMARMTTQKDVLPEKREQILCHTQEMVNKFKEILPNVADTALLEVQGKMLEIIFEAPEEKQKTLMHFYFMTNLAFNLKNKPLSRAEFLEKNKKMAGLIDRAIVYEPFISLELKKKFFDEMGAVKERLKRKEQLLSSKKTIAEILKQRGGYEKE